MAGPGGSDRGVDRDLLERALPAHAARGRGVERARGRIARQRPGDLDGVGREVLREPGRARPIDQALAPEEPERELVVVPGGAHGDGERPRRPRGSPAAPRSRPRRRSRRAPLGGSGSWPKPFEQRREDPAGRVLAAEPDQRAVGHQQRAEVFAPERRPAARAGRSSRPAPSSSARSQTAASSGEPGWLRAIASLSAGSAICISNRPLKYRTTRSHGSTARAALEMPSTFAPPAQG